MQIENRKALKQFNRDADCIQRQTLPEQPRAPSECPHRVTTEDELRGFVGVHAADIARKANILCYGSHDSSQEVVQELYPRLLKVLQRSPEGLQNPWAVIHQVAARLAIDCHRQNVRRQTVKELPHPESIVDKGRKDTSTFDAILAAIEVLPDRLKAIVLGIFIEGCKAKDIARNLGLSESRVAELKQIALTLLREELEKTLS